MRQINEIIVHCTATRADWWSDREFKEMKSSFTKVLDKLDAIEQHLRK